MKENNSITAEELIKDLQEVFDGNGVPNLNYVKAKLNEYKENTVTLEQLEEEVFKACQMGIYIEQTQYTDSQKEIIETYFKNEVLPKYKRDE